MHDSQIEQELRTALRAEGEAPPLTITAAELERRLAARRRQANGRRLSLVAAAVAVVAVGSMVALTNGWLRLPAVGVVPQPSASAAPATAPGSSPTPTSGERVSEPLGYPGEAILVRPIGYAARPDSFQVWRLDPLTDISVLIATVPGAVLPPDGRLGKSGPPSVSLTGWLAIPFQRAPAPGGIVPAIAVVDVRDPSAAAVIFDGYTAISWGVADGRWLENADGQVDLGYPNSNEVVRFTVRGQSVTFSRGGRFGGPATSTEDGSSRFLASQTIGATTVQGTVGYDGLFTPKTDLPPVFERTGLERPAGAGAHTLRIGCDTTGASPDGTGCILVESDAAGGPIRTVILTHGTKLFDDVWAADGRQVWFVDGSIADGDMVATLSVADAPGTRDDRATFHIPGSLAQPAILGITSETQPGKALVAIGDDAGFVWAFVAADGSVHAQDGKAWFAGWAGQQPDYDPD
jgi:hypothetical protein